MAVPVCTTEVGQTTTVCASGPPTTCETTAYLVEVCTDSSGGGDGVLPIILPEFPGYMDNDADQNRNLRQDCWGGVVDTNDPCSKNFDSNDGLGTDYGGTNSVRPDHSGVDIQGNTGDTVAAMAFGKVDARGNGIGGPGCGIAVRINHAAAGLGGTSSTYCHLSGTSVQVNEWVLPGQDIGFVGSTGSSTGPHLHVSFKTPSCGRDSYYKYTDKQPGSSNLKPNGC
jgi:murein DD-endopeptidase MepM/ murein hydrolase activator NlpD